MNAIQSWLTYPHSLTERLRSKSGDAVLTVLSEHFDDVDSWDQKMLGLDDIQVWRREIMVSAHHVPCWYACTIVPKTTLMTNPSFFAQLKTKTLGQLIYDSPIVKRISLIYESVDAFARACYEFPREPFSQQGRMRLSTFRLREDGLFFLVEVFLPGIERYCD